MPRRTTRAYYRRSSRFGCWSSILVLVGLFFVYIRLSEKPWPLLTAERRAEIARLWGEVESKFSGGSKARPGQRTAEKKPREKIDLRWSDGSKGRRTPRVGAEQNSNARPSVHLDTDDWEAPPRSGLEFSVVLVRGVSSDKTLTLDLSLLREQTVGHGFVVRRDPQGVLLVTSAHVLREGEVEVSASAKGPYLPAEIVRADAASDLALLRVSWRALPNARALNLEREARLVSGDSCFVARVERASHGVELLAGEVLGQNDDAREGIAETFGAARAAGDWYLISQRGYRGLSGAPVLDRKGRVAGVLIGGVESPVDRSASIVMGPRSITALLASAKPPPVP